MDNDKINPAHYKDGFKCRTIECIDVVGKLPFCLGNAIKYIWRAGKKPGEDWRTDIEKAMWYIERYYCSMGEERPRAVDAAIALMNQIDREEMYKRGDSFELARFDAIFDSLTLYGQGYFSPKEFYKHFREQLEKQEKEEKQQ